MRDKAPRAGGYSDEVVVTSGAAAHTKGAWTTAIASMPFDGYVQFHFAGVGAASASALLDVAIGSAGSEQIVWPDYLARGDLSGGTACRIVQTPWIPAGQRVAMRSQTEVANRVVRAYAWATTAPALGLPSAVRRVFAWGVNASATRGTPVSSGGPQETFGSWTEIVASTPTAVRAVLVWPEVPSTGIATERVRVQLGLGAAGAEQVLYDYILSAVAGSYLSVRGWPSAVFAAIPAGSRLSIRTANIAGGTTSQIVIDFVLYGLA